MTKESEIPRPSRPSSPTTHQIPCSGTTADPQWLRALYDSLGCLDLPVVDPQWASRRLWRDWEAVRLDLESAAQPDREPAPHLAQGEPRCLTPTDSRSRMS